MSIDLEVTLMGDSFDLLQERLSRISELLNATQVPTQFQESQKLVQGAKACETMWELCQSMPRVTANWREPNEKMPAMHRMLNRWITETGHKDLSLERFGQNVNNIEQDVEEPDPSLPSPVNDGDRLRRSSKVYVLSDETECISAVMIDQKTGRRWLLETEWVVRNNRAQLTKFLGEGQIKRNPKNKKVEFFSFAENEQLKKRFPLKWIEFKNESSSKLGSEFKSVVLKLTPRRLSHESKGSEEVFCNQTESTQTIFQRVKINSSMRLVDYDNPQKVRSNCLEFEKDCAKEGILDKPQNLSWRWFRLRDGALISTDRLESTSDGSHLEEKGSRQLNIVTCWEGFLQGVSNNQGGVRVVEENKNSVKTEDLFSEVAEAQFCPKTGAIKAIAVPFDEHKKREEWAMHVKSLWEREKMQNKIVDHEALDQENKMRGRKVRL